ncbi:MAG: TIGR04086 family membrane protein [Lawsonibacter sp.]|nr:TIGR04086 family membrane protein [Lawsonibacter sp.]
MCELLKGGVLAGVVTILALLACAVLVSSGLLRECWMVGSVLAVCVIGAFAGGTYAVQAIGGRALFVGLGVGLVLFLLLLTAGLLAFETASLEQGGIGICCACLCGGAISGMLGRKPKKKRKR